MQVKKSVRNFYNRGTARWSWLLAIMLAVIGLVLNLPPALAALTPNPIVVDSQVKVNFTVIEFNRHSNTFDGWALLTNRSVESISTPIRLVINNIKPTTVTLANVSGLQSDGSPYVEVLLNDGVLSPGEIVRSLLKFNNPNRVKFTFNHSILGVIPNVNHPPVANAGADQNAFVGSVVTLDGSGSTDEDSNHLTYHWRIVSQPANSTAVLANASAIKPRLTIDRKGNYQIELIVNDGIADSRPATLLITTENSKPVAVAGDNQTVFVKQTALLDGILSQDIDGDPLTFYWQLSASPATSLATLQNPDTQSYPG